MKKGSGSIHKHNENPVRRILKVDEVKSATDDIGGTYVQNRYTLQRENGDEQKVTDEEIADQLHPLDILFMKDHYEKEKKNNQEVRRALNGISKAGILLFERMAFSDFDLCINYEHVHNKKVYFRSPKTKVPSEILDDARSGDIIMQTSKDGEQEYGVIFRDQDNNKALFRSVDICKYSNQTLRYILKTMNKRQEHLQKIEKNLDGSRKEIEQMIEEWIQAREWYKDMYVSCKNYISYKKKIKKGDMHKSVKLN